MRSHLVNVYLHALNEMQGTKPGLLARIADRMSSQAFDNATPSADPHIKMPSSDAMMQVEASIFMALCDANGVDWRVIRPE